MKKKHNFSHVRLWKDVSRQWESWRAEEQIWNWLAQVLQKWGMRNFQEVQCYWLRTVQFTLRNYQWYVLRALLQLDDVLGTGTRFWMIQTIFIYSLWIALDAIGLAQNGLLRLSSPFPIRLWSSCRTDCLWKFALLEGRIPRILMLGKTRDIVSMLHGWSWSETVWLQHFTKGLRAWLGGNFDH